MMNSDIKKAIPVQWLLDSGVVVMASDRITDGEASTRYNLDPRYKDWSVFEFCSRNHCPIYTERVTKWRPNFKSLYYKYNAEVLEVKAQQKRVEDKKAQKIKDEIYKIVDSNSDATSTVENIFNLFNPRIVSCIDRIATFEFDIKQANFRLGVQMRLMKLNNQIAVSEHLYDKKTISHYDFKHVSSNYRNGFANDIYNIRPGAEL